MTDLFACVATRDTAYADRACASAGRLATTCALWAAVDAMRERRAAMDPEQSSRISAALHTRYEALTGVRLDGTTEPTMEDAA